MSSFGGFFDRSDDPFNDLLNRFFGMSPEFSPPRVQRVPIGELVASLLLSGDTNPGDTIVADEAGDHLVCGMGVGGGGWVGGGGCGCGGVSRGDRRLDRMCGLLMVYRLFTASRMV
jgi:hypothetical protein